MSTLFVGEINPDFVFSGLQSPPTLDRETIASDFGLRVGSSTAICACAFGGLNGSGEFAGMIGNDYFGSFMVEQLNRYGIDTSYVVKTDTVRTGVTACLNHRNTRTQVTFPGAIEEFDASNVTGAVMADFAHLHSSGVFLQKRLLPSLARIFSEARSLGLSTSLDTQWDPSEHWQGLSDILPYVDTLFLNQSEYDSIRASFDSAYPIRTLNPDIDIVLKKGANGAELIDRSQKPLSIPAKRVDNFVDTTGAGDNFNAGYLYAAKVRRKTKAESLEFGSVVAAVSCSAIGGVAEISMYRTAVEESLV